MTKDSLLFYLRFHREINIFAELLCCPVSGHNNNNVITIYTCNFDRQVTYKLLLHLQSVWEPSIMKKNDWGVWGKLRKRLIKVGDAKRKNENRN